MEDKKVAKKGFKWVNRTMLIEEQNKKINSLENELETLKSNVKDELYKKLMEKFDEPLVIQRLRKENKRLKEKIEKMKGEIKWKNLVRKILSKY